MYAYTFQTNLLAFLRDNRGVGKVLNLKYAQIVTHYVGYIMGLEALNVGNNKYVEERQITRVLFTLSQAYTSQSSHVYTRKINSIYQILYSCLSLMTTQSRSSNSQYSLYLQSRQMCDGPRGK